MEAWSLGNQTVLTKSTHTRSVHPSPGAPRIHGVQRMWLLAPAHSHVVLPEIRNTPLQSQWHTYNAEAASLLNMVLECPSCCVHALTAWWGEKRGTTLYTEQVYNFRKACRPCRSVLSTTSRNSAASTKIVGNERTTWGCEKRVKFKHSSLGELSHSPVFGFRLLRAVEGVSCPTSAGSWKPSQATWEEVTSFVAKCKRLLAKRQRVRV